MKAQRIYLLVQGLVVLAVMGLFQVMARDTASMIASMLFVVSNGFVIYWEGFKLGRKTTPSFVATLIYSLLFVLPIASARIFGGGVPLSAMQLGPISGAHLHQMSNIAFLLVLVCYFVDLTRNKKDEP